MHPYEGKVLRSSYADCVADKCGVEVFRVVSQKVRVEMVAQTSQAIRDMTSMCLSAVERHRYSRELYLAGQERSS